MGGVRGDVIALAFIYTTIMEMGQPPAVQSDELFHSVVDPEDLEDWVWE
jgi:hypothetical protein